MATNSILNFIKSQDSFGSGYQITFKGRTTQQSIFGGLLGVLMLVLLAYFGYY